ncbi:hypothetical protein [Kitasatospora sp. NPDC127116]|uniref:hypothetical protein n=1 Tax=Kitasatospora sp. NPDC127116 TaxID=3345367 RepID=UPI00362ADC82
MPTPLPPSAPAGVIPLPAADLLTHDPSSPLADPHRLVGDDWLTPTVDAVLRLLDQADPRALAAGSHTGPGHTLLLLAAPRDGHPAWYLRLPDGTAAAPRPTGRTTAVLPLAGTLHLALYRDQDDIDRQSPQYLRTLHPGQLCLLHAGATTLLAGAPDSVQLVLTHLPPTDPDLLPLSAADYPAAATTARYRLTAPRRDDDRPGGALPEDIPDLRGADLPRLHAQAGALHRLAADRALLSYLTTTTVLAPERYEASRTTLLEDRLVLAAADDRGFEISLNTRHHPATQRVPHNHAHPHTVRVLAGGYLHTVSLRTDGRTDGPFTTRDLRRAVTTTELPGSSYTLAPTLVRQAAMLPRTSLLMLRGPHAADAHAAADLVPALFACRESADSETPPLSRPLTDDEHRTTYSCLAEDDVIDCLPPRP